MVRFSRDEWDRVRADCAAWWEGRLRRPLVQMRIKGAEAGRGLPRLRQVSRADAYNRDISSEAIVDSWDYLLSSCRYAGDAFPSVWPDLGPGVLAAFLGAKPSLASGTVWFEPREGKSLSELNLEYDEDNPWFERLAEILKAAAGKWEGLVQVGMTDLGGVVDVLSAFRPGEKLLLDLYDSPGEVKGLVREIHRLWWKYFESLNRIMRPPNPGYTAWTPIYSDTPYYILQCDFAYMLGTDMFEEFVKPELEASCLKLGNAFYHLDGVGQLKHIDSLLDIEQLKGVQWVPGEGSASEEDWGDVYRKIKERGKLIQLSGEPETLDGIAEQLGNAEGVVFMTQMHVSQASAANSFLEKYGSVNLIT